MIVCRINNKYFKEALKRLDSIDVQGIANVAVNHYKAAFNTGGLEGRANWKEGHKNGGTTLVESGDLRRNIKVLKISKTGFSIISDLPYSALQNFGSTQHVTPKQLKFFKYQISKYYKTDQANYEKWLKIYLKAVSTGELNYPKRMFMDSDYLLNQKIIAYIKKYF